ncbi:nephronectin a isoform X1 [Hemitrygon akajei]|uniref:nephronectin a isoform X1 n=1 Tax=Hemitrygon akajei TaxID=2704970 RepID=UPI003BF9945D
MTDVRHVSAKDSVVADVLSRPNIHALSQGVDFEALAEAQQADEEIPSYRTAVSGLQLQDLPIGPGERTLLCDVATGQPRPVVPANWRRHVFDSIHNLVHPSIRTTVRMVSSRFVWHGLCKQVSEWARTCMHCQTAKVQRHTKALPQQFHPTHRRFDHIHVDIVGPLPVSRGARHLLTIVDRFTRWPEAILLTDTTSKSCARALIATWVSRFGVPAHITSDRGAQFTSSLWSAMASLLGTQLHHTTAYHPQSNGLVERFHRHLKSALMARLRGANWADKLPWVLLGIRTVPKDDLHASSAGLVYGVPLVVPGEFIPAPRGQEEEPAAVLGRLRERLGDLSPIPTSQHGQNPTCVPKDLQNFPPHGRNNETLSTVYVENTTPAVTIKRTTATTPVVNSNPEVETERAVLTTNPTTVTTTATTMATTMAMTTTTSAAIIIIPTPVDNRIPSEVPRQRGDVFIPRQPGGNGALLELDIEMGITAEENDAGDDQDILVNSCNFDHGMCGWTQEKHAGLHWERVPDPSGRGWYLTLPVSNYKRREAAHLLLALGRKAHTGNLCLTFRHKLSGDSPGKIQVFVRRNGSYGYPLWERNRGHGWRTSRFTLRGPGLESVIFKGVQEKKRGIIGLDDISLQNGHCSGKPWGQ